MGFHPERLTGARRRARDFADKYAPTVAQADGKVPKVVYRLLRHPERLKACVRLGRGKDSRTHYLVVVGQDVVLLDHPDEASQENIAFLAGAATAWACPCRTTRDFYVTLPDHKYRNRKARDRTIDRLDSITDLPDRLVPVRMACRPPVGRYRLVEFDRRRGRRGLDERTSDRPTAAAPYPKNFNARWGKISEKAQALFELCLGSDLTAAAAGLNAPVAVMVQHTFGERLLVSQIVRVYGTAGKVGVTLDADPWTWYVRVRGADLRPPHGVVPVSAFSLGGNVHVAAGLDCSKLAAGWPAATIGGEDRCNVSLPLVFWSPGGAVWDLNAAALAAMRRVEFGLRVVHRITAADDARKAAAAADKTKES